MGEIARASFETYKKLPTDEKRFAQGLAYGEELTELAKTVGWDMEKARRLSQSGTMMAAAACVVLGRIHRNMVPRAINTIESLLGGSILVTEKSENGRIIKKSQTVKPETMLAAANAVLKIAGYDKPPDRLRDPGATGDLADLSRDQIQGLVRALETKLAETSKPVSAPNDIEEAEIIEDLPSNYSVLD